MGRDKAVPRYVYMADAISLCLTSVVEALAVIAQIPVMIVIVLYALYRVDL